MIRRTHTRNVSFLVGLQGIKARHDFYIYSLTQVHEETGVLLIKPMDLIPRLEDIKEDVKEINEDDILEAVNIPKERAKRRKSELMAQAAAAKEPSLSMVKGEEVSYERNQSSSWKVSGDIIMMYP